MQIRVKLLLKPLRHSRRHCCRQYHIEHIYECNKDRFAKINHHSRVQLNSKEAGIFWTAPAPFQTLAPNMCISKVIDPMWVWFFNLRQAGMRRGKLDAPSRVLENDRKTTTRRATVLFRHSFHTLPENFGLRASQAVGQADWFYIPKVCHFCVTVFFFIFFLVRHMQFVQFH